MSDGWLYKPLQAHGPYRAPTCYPSAMVLRGEPKPKGDAWCLATVGGAAASGSHWRPWCSDCRHSVTLSATDLIEVHHVAPDTPFWTLVQRLKCGACRSLKVGMRAGTGRDIILACDARQ